MNQASYLARNDIYLSLRVEGDVDLMRSSTQFDEQYFRSGFGPDSYERNANWLTFYGKVADNIVSTLSPKTVLDAGCALGMIVESLWDRGVVAEGIDISEFAIANVRADMKPYCKVGTLVEPYTKLYDLVVCIEVLEHMNHADSVEAIRNFAAASDMVLFSSTPDDLVEITHVNVKPVLAWIKLFAELGFVPDLNYDASYIVPHAILFRKGPPPSDEALRLFAGHLRMRKQQSLRQAQITEISQALGDSQKQEKQLTLRANDLDAELAATRKIIGALKSKLSQSLREKADLKNKIEVERPQSYTAVVDRDISGELTSMASLLNETQARLGEAQTRLHHIEQSGFWRAGAPLRRTISSMPSFVRDGIRKTLKAGYWMVTPHKMPQRLRFLRDRKAGLLHSVNANEPIDVSASTIQPLPTLSSYVEHDVHLAAGNAQPTPSPPEAIAIQDLVQDTFPDLAPLPVYFDKASQGSVVILTDSVESHSLFGGVATAIVVAAMLADKLGYRLRLVTRTGPPDTATIGPILRLNGIQFDGPIDSAHIPYSGEGILAVGPADIILTTSWWTTHATRLTVPVSQILYLLQEDERMFYSYNDRHLLCGEILADETIVKLINSNLLFSHLYGCDVSIGGARSAVPFEPAFPAFGTSDELDAPKPKRNFFFYARPQHDRNLFWRGVEAIDRCVLRGLFPEDEWDLHFVGPNCPEIVLSNGVRPTVHRSMPWDKYIEFIGKIDLGLSLMYTPHTSYPPLDLAAAGAVVVTNRFGVKSELTQYSENIVMSDLSVESLVASLKDGVAKSGDFQRRSLNRARDQITRSWQETLPASLDMIIQRLGR